MAPRMGLPRMGCSTLCRPPIRCDSYSKERKSNKNKEKELVMRKAICGAMIASLVLGLGAGALRGQDKAGLDRLGQRATELNQTAKKPGMMKVALQRVSNETGVPLTEVEAMHKHYPDAGPAGVMLA